MNKALLATIILIFASTICPAAGSQKKDEPNRPTAQELLKKYAETQDKLGLSFIIKQQTEGKWDALDSTRPNIQKGVIYEVYDKYEIRCDGKSFLILDKSWGDRAGANPVPEDFGQSLYVLWDGNVNYQYTLALAAGPSGVLNERFRNGRLIITPKEQFKIFHRQRLRLIEQALVLHEVFYGARRIG